MAGRKKAAEGMAEILLGEGVFYNPEMELCRDLSSLCVGALGGKLSVLDAMCASGVRGLRYKLETENVSRLLLSDLSARAVALARKNAAANRVRCRVLQADACFVLQKEEFDLVELDPFGSPVPFLYDAARSFSSKKRGLLSVTATDMAVLCGAHHAACLKNYGAAPLNNEFCHESAVRILAGKMALTAAPLNLGSRPVFSLSHRHYVKVFFALDRGSHQAVDAVKSNGFVSYCPSCCWREAARWARKESCPHCGHILQVAGPLWLGKLWDSQIVEKMLALNAERDCGKKAQAERLLSTILSESRIGANGYYDLHVLAKKMLRPIIGMDEAIGRLRSAGFAAERTHFCPTAMRTDAPHDAVIGMVRG